MSLDSHVRVAFAIALAVALSSCGKNAPPVVYADNLADPSSASLAQPSPAVSGQDLDAAKQACDLRSPAVIELIPDRKGRVYLAVTGRLAETFVRVGDVVSKGQVLATIESSDGDAAISANKQAASALEAAKSALGKASTDLERVRSLVAAVAAPAKALLNAEFEFQLASTSVAQAEANLRQTEERLRLLGLQPGLLGQRIAMLAPISGKISEVLGVPGEFRNNLNDPIFTISDSSSVWVTAQVAEAVSSRFRLGDTVLIEMVAYPGETFRARVTQIADTVDAATRTVRVRSEVQSPASRLKPEMYGWACHEPQTPSASTLDGKLSRSFDGEPQL